MTRYKKLPALPKTPPKPAAALALLLAPMIGMLYVVDVRLVKAKTREKIRHRLLIVGSEAQDIERKLQWIFDCTEYSEMSITATEKVREKVHFLSTVIEQVSEPVGPVVAVGERTMAVPQQTTSIEAYDPNLYAIGVTTTMLAKDEAHALRKIGRALIVQGTEGKSHSAAGLSDDSTVQIERIPKTSGYAMPRDVSQESNKAHVMRG